MSLPELTAEQRQTALDHARFTRAERAKIAGNLTIGSVTVQHVLERASSPEDKVARGMKAAQLIKALPGVGRSTADRYIEQLGINPVRKRVGGLGQVQRAALLQIASEHGR